ncbi:MAG: hypothetical protein FRX48_02306 [Lasallia pustulata]|uniref:Uncharacterized protein n=1 Tax=Lasallia pustulata TaxID=136370 RepID=A0A5M8PXY2_9LECA|nr:MAG: hypothetical protein FRX48_02306 [Lasallia pustulata]
MIIIAACRHRRRFGSITATIPSRDWELKDPLALVTRGLNSLRSATPVPASHILRLSAGRAAPGVDDVQSGTEARRTRLRGAVYSGDGRVSWQLVGAGNAPESAEGCGDRG